MGNGVFLFRSQLRHGAGIAVRLKHGVIAEAVFPARRKQDAALARAAGAQDVAVRERAADARHEPGRAVGAVAEVMEQERVAIADLDAYFADKFTF